MAVVTVSRQTGSDGDDVARMVAADLGVPYAAREIIEKAAFQAGLPQEVLDAKEKESSQERTFATSDMVGLVRRSQTGRRQQLADSLYLQYVSEAVRQFAADSCVIAGRGSQFILQDRPDAVHVHIYAPEAFRVARMMQLEQLSREAAQRAVRIGDAERAAFTKRYFNNANWRNPDYYNLMVDTGRIGVDAAAAIIVAAARSLG
ncbi:MAG: cytidylate kinase-like family protein [Anaerolineae bacterium]|nr:cytidylate kinase-like family protein [Anaerolineae bacterium]